jgi:hypothetical protein
MPSDARPRPAVYVRSIPDHEPTIDDGHQLGRCAHRLTRLGYDAKEALFYADHERDANPNAALCDLMRAAQAGHVSTVVVPDLECFGTERYPLVLARLAAAGVGVATMEEIVIDGRIA